MRKLKVVGINGSSLKDGNTAIIIKTVFEELEKEGIETELIQLYDKEIKGCRGCFACGKKKQCIIKDDFFNECFTKIAEAKEELLYKHEKKEKKI